MTSPRPETSRNPKLLGLGAIVAVAGIFGLVSERRAQEAPSPEAAAEVATSASTQPVARSTPSWQFFKVLARNGQPADDSYLRDTVLVRGRESVDVGMVPVDWGSWMMHCHILEHAESGMMTVLEVGK